MPFSREKYVAISYHACSRSHGHEHFIYLLVCTWDLSFCGRWVHTSDFLTLTRRYSNIHGYISEVIIMWTLPPLVISLSLSVYGFQYNGMIDRWYMIHYDYDINCYGLCEFDDPIRRYFLFFWVLKFLSLFGSDRSSRNANLRSFVRLVQTCLELSLAVNLHLSRSESNRAVRKQSESTKRALKSESYCRSL